MKQKEESTGVVCAAVATATDRDEMRNIIASDLDRAEVGMFSMLRAGVGLLCFKAMSDHGEWESRLMELCPGKSPRTLQTYMKQARDFADSRGITPEQAWPELSKIDAEKVRDLILDAGPDVKQLGTGAEPEAAPTAKRGRGKAKDPAHTDGIDQTFSQMLIDFIQQRKSKGKSKDAPPPRPLTKREKIDAAIAEANRIINVTADWIADGTWALLPDDELESTMAGLRASSDKITQEFRNRK